jgi:hypothetical protein
MSMSSPRWQVMLDHATPWLLLLLGCHSLSALAADLEARVNRHALIIGISKYADPITSPLPGARVDRQSATQMAQAMQVPLGNIAYLQDEQATGAGIRSALQALNGRVQDGDRVFIHYSGHGTRFNDPATGGCVEALLAYDGGSAGTITNHEMAELLSPMTRKTDKMFVMYDACHSGGVVNAASSGGARSLAVAEGEGRLRPKVAGISQECGQPMNIKNRSLAVQAQAQGVLKQDIIHISAARDNEISFDDELKGGLATQFMRDCMLRDAKDDDQSGAVSMEEIRACAQEKINQRMRKDPYYQAHHLVLQGNHQFVPAWFSQALAQSAPAGEPTIAALTGEQALRQLLDQADAKRHLQVTLAKDKLKIGQDTMQLTVQSDRAGYLYVVMAGSDNKTLEVLFPNDLDRDNRIEPGRPLALPRAQWRVRASGPPGMDHVLVMVTDGPRDLAGPGSIKTGPFVTSLNDTGGRAQLGALMTTSVNGSQFACSDAGKPDRQLACSDAYAAKTVKIEEIK